jgi:hypothetical protein
VCWEAISSYGGTLTNYQAPDYTTYIGDCNDCTFDNGGGCVSANTVFSAATLTRCEKPEDTIIVDIPTGTTLGVTFVIGGQCYSFLNFETGTTGNEYYPQYDGCVLCESFFPFQYSFSGCCEYIDEFSGNTPIYFNLNSVPSGLDVGESVYVETTTYTGCAVNIVYDSSYQLDLYTATTIYDDCADCQIVEPSCYVNAYWENCCDSSQITLITNISSTFYPTNSIEVGGQCYFYTGIISYDTPVGNTDDYLNNYPDCDVCEISYPCPSASPTPTPTVTPTLSPTPTPTPTPSSSGINLLNPLSYTISVTGTCENSVGTACINVSGGVPGYTIDWINPVLGTGACKTNLSNGTYVVRINDSASPVNNELYVNVNISGSFSVVLTNVTDTSCGEDNGSVDVAVISPNTNVTYYLYSGNTLIDSQFTNNGVASFVPLPSGVYSITAVSDSNCSGSTPTFVINPSIPFDYGFYIVNDTECKSPTGKLYITGQTGTAPYTYLWGDGQTTSSITGLTAGSYDVTVTDSNGCTLSKSALVEFVPSLGLGSWVGSSPSCYASDGSLTLTITGGTGPYYYSGSNGTNIVTYSQSYTFTGLPAGPFFVNVTDAALCKVTFSTTLMTPKSFYGVGVNLKEPTCSNANGSVSISLQGGSPPYTYSISGDTIVFDITTNSTQYDFDNLVAGTYDIEITDGGDCPYTETVELTSVNLFEVVYSATSASCGLSNGTLSLSGSTGGVLPYTYTLDNGDSITSSGYQVSFPGLSGGSYFYTVTDLNGCSFTGVANVPDVTSLQFSLFPTSCGLSGEDGTITALITQGSAPFTYLWSDNVIGNPQQIYVTGLTAGIYSLTITDDNGCVQTRTIEITCNPVLTTYQTYTMCESDFTFTSGQKNGFLQMLNQGFQNIVDPVEGCILDEALFTISIEVDGVTYTDTFFTGYTLLDIPTDTQYFDAVEDLLLTIPGVTGVDINQITGDIQIFTNDLGNQSVSIELIIDYTISCPTDCP